MKHYMGWKNHMKTAIQVTLIRKAPEKAVLTIEKNIKRTDLRPAALDIYSGRSYCLKFELKNGGKQ